jgi:hypothetical protein
MYFNFVVIKASLSFNFEIVLNSISAVLHLNERIDS